MRLLFLILFFAAPVFANDILLIGGEPVKPGQYPEVVRTRSCSENGRCYGCTASVVGKRVVLTAAHCIADMNQISFMLGQNSYTAKCKRHPLYPDTEDMDTALCKTDRDMDVKFAHVSKTGPEIGDTVTLIGYGCINPRKPDGSGGNGGNDGILRVGEAPVYQLPMGTNNWYYTRDSTALCFGDSGGPSFKRVMNPENDTHYVMGVNSRGNIVDRSLLAATYIKKNMDWMEDYEQDEGVEICGLASSCGAGPDPDPDPDDCEYEEYKVGYHKRKVLLWQERLDQCQADIFQRLPFPEDDFNLPSL